MQSTLVIYESQKRFWERNACLVGIAFYERELPRAFAQAQEDPDGALGRLAVLCPGLLELVKESDPANSLAKE